MFLQNSSNNKMSQKLVILADQEHVGGECLYGASVYMEVVFIGMIYSWKKPTLFFFSFCSFLVSCCGFILFYYSKRFPTLCPSQSLFETINVTVWLVNHREYFFKLLPKFGRMFVIIYLLCMYVFVNVATPFNFL